MDIPELTSAERRALRAEGQRLVDGMQIGHHGITEPVLKELDGLLLRQPLVKVRAAETDRRARQVLFTDLGVKVGAALVGSVGRTALLYRPRTPPEQASA